MNRLLWQAIKDVLAVYDAALTLEGKHPRRAAVLALLTDSPVPELIFTQRSAGLRHHAGEVCFPGGMWESQDNGLLASALREVHEEIGVPPSMIEVLGALPIRQTKSGTWVQPFVGRIPSSCRFTLNAHELDVLFRVPIDMFSKGLQIRTDVFEREGRQYHIPVYQYENYKIWGFTASVTADLLKLLLPLMRSPA